MRLYWSVLYPLGTKSSLNKHKTSGTSSKSLWYVQFRSCVQGGDSEQKLDCFSFHTTNHGVKSVQIRSFFSGPHFPVFGMNTETYSLNLCIQSEYGKIRTRKNFLFGHFSRSEWEYAEQSKF